MKYHESFILSTHTNFFSRSGAYTSIGETTHEHCVTLTMHVWQIRYNFTIFDTLLDLVCRRTVNEQPMSLMCVATGEMF